MARLVLINGAPASGKSTLARTYIDEHPLVLALDLDVVRAMLGRWLDDAVEAGLTTRRMVLEMARVQLKAGRDVLVPQLLGLLDVVARRPRTRTITTVDGEVARAYRDLLAHLDEA